MHTTPAHNVHTTCARTSACDSAGEVWEVAGLYVADGSTFPTPSGVNPMISIYGIAHQTARGIARRWKAGQLRVPRSGGTAAAGRVASRPM